MSKVSILPVTVEVDGVIVHILEVLKSKLGNNTVFYHAVCKVEWNGVTTRNFVVTFRTEEEFREKLRIEVAKLKLMSFLYGGEFLRKVVSP